MLISFKAIGRNIRAARMDMNLTQEDVAERLKISQLHFGRLERGDRPASLEMLALIADILETPLSALLNGCVVNDRFDLKPAGAPESLGHSIAVIANGCSPQAQRLMLELCKAVAQSDKAD